MNQLYSIMEQLLKLDYEEETYLFVLKTLEASFDEKQEPHSKMLASHAKWQLESQNRLLKRQIHELDNYICTK